MGGGQAFPFFGVQGRSSYYLLGNASGALATTLLGTSGEASAIGGVSCTVFCWQGLPGVRGGGQEGTFVMDAPGDIAISGSYNAIPLGTATKQTPLYPSNRIILQGSTWNGTTAQKNQWEIFQSPQSSTSDTLGFADRKNGGAASLPFFFNDKTADGMAVFTISQTRPELSLASALNPVLLASGNCSKLFTVTPTFCTTIGSTQASGSDARGDTVFTGHIAAADSITCASNSGVPCVFAWTCSIAAAGSKCAKTTKTVPALSNCTLTLTTNPVVSGSIIEPYIVSLKTNTLTIGASTNTSIADGATVTGNGHCL